MKNILSLTKKLISIKSTFDNPKALDKILNLVLSELEGFTVEKFENKGIKSVLIYNSKIRPKKFKLILNGHLDVVPGKDHLYKPVVRNDRLYGVGAMDMKASIACIIMAFKKVADKVDYPLGLQLVTDEEIGGFDGTKFQIDDGIRAHFVVAAEPTNLNIVNKAKGILCLKISSKGKTAHGAYVWRGKNAIWEMNKFLNIFKKKFPIPTTEEWVTTVNLSKIETNNNSFNKIPDDCTVWLDIRFIPDEANTILQNIKDIIPIGFNLKITVFEPALFVKENNQFIKKLQVIAKEVTNNKVVLYGANGSSDARHFSQVNCNGIEFGPIGGNIGADNEWVSISSLDKYCQILTKFLLSL